MNERQLLGSEITIFLILNKNNRHAIAENLTPQSRHIFYPHELRNTHVLRRTGEKFVLFRFRKLFHQTFFVTVNFLLRHHT